MADMSYNCVGKPLILRVDCGKKSMEKGSYLVSNLNRTALSAQAGSSIKDYVPAQVMISSYEGSVTTPIFHIYVEYTVHLMKPISSFDASIYAGIYRSATRLIDPAD